MNKCRLIIQAASVMLTNGYIKGFLTGRIFKGPSKLFCTPGLNCYSCPGAFTSCPIGALQSVLNSGRFSFSCYIFGFLTVMGILAGRFVCGFLCPFGFVQDLLYKIPFTPKRKNLPGHRVLKYLKYAVLAIFVILLPALLVNKGGVGTPWFCKLICPDGALFAGIPLVLSSAALRDATGLLFGWKVLLLVIIILLSIKTYRPFCKYLCPLGAIYSGFNPVSFYRFHVDGDRCVKCGACQKVCKMGVKVFEQPNSPECIRCGDCLNACPRRAVRAGAASVKRTGERRRPGRIRATAFTFRIDKPLV
jgi:polyferredoxin